MILFFFFFRLLHKCWRLAMNKYNHQQFRYSHKKLYSSVFTKDFLFHWSCKFCSSLVNPCNFYDKNDLWIIGINLFSLHTIILQLFVKMNYTRTFRVTSVLPNDFKITCLGWNVDVADQSKCLFYLVILIHGHRIPGCGGARAPLVFKKCQRCFQVAAAVLSL